MPEERVRDKGKTVSFLLPSGGGIPIGGFKIVYEYANRLADRGWHIRVVHPCLLTVEEIEAIHRSPRRRARAWLRYQRRIVTGDYRPRWFNVSPKVEMLCTKTPEPRYIPSSDIWVATWWYTAKWVATYPGSGIYLIQHLETFGGPESDVMATWKLPLRKVVSSQWLEDVAHSLGESASYITYGLDFSVFGMDVTPEQRDPHTVAMLYHESDWKGCADGLEALRIARASAPKMKAILFGTPQAPADLPSWVEYYRKPPQPLLRQIYNRSAIFLCPSWAEGWGLPPAEALQCGSALAITENGGHREYAFQGETALLSPPKKPEALATNLIRLLQDQELRLRLARQGHLYIQRFTWDRAVTSFESVLHDALAHRSASRPISDKNVTVPVFS